MKIGERLTDTAGNVYEVLNEHLNESHEFFVKIKLESAVAVVQSKSNLK